MGKAHCYCRSDSFFPFQTPAPSYLFPFFFLLFIQSLFSLCLGCPLFPHSSFLCSPIFILLLIPLLPFSLFPFTMANPTPVPRRKFLPTFHYHSSSSLSSIAPRSSSSFFPCASSPISANWASSALHAALPASLFRSPSPVSSPQHAPPLTLSSQPLVPWYGRGNQTHQQFC